MLSLILETCCIMVSVDSSFTSSNVTRISTLCLAVFIKANNDPVLVQLVQDVVKELSSTPGCSSTIQTKFVPTLTSILVASSDKVCLRFEKFWIANVLVNLYVFLYLILASVYCIYSSIMLIS